MSQTIKYTITAQAAFDVTVSFIFPDASTLAGVHLDLTALGEQILATVPAPTPAQEAALLDAYVFEQGLSIWQGQLAAAAVTAAKTALVSALSTLLNVQRTVTQ